MDRYTGQPDKQKSEPESQASKLVQESDWSPRAGFLKAGHVRSLARTKSSGRPSWTPARSAQGLPTLDPPSGSRDNYSEWRPRTLRELRWSLTMQNQQLPSSKPGIKYIVKIKAKCLRWFPVALSRGQKRAYPQLAKANLSGPCRITKNIQKQKILAIREKDSIE